MCVWTRGVRYPGLATVARESQATFHAFDARRLAVVARDAEDLRVKLEQVRSHLAAQPDATLSSPSGIHYAAGAPAGEVDLRPSAAEIGVAASIP